MYGEVLELSLGGVKLRLAGKLNTGKVELAPHKSLSGGVPVIPLAYHVRWQSEGDKPTVGLQFANGTDAFFRGWLAEHLKPLMVGDSLLDQRELVRVPCELEGRLRRDDGKCPCAVIDMSVMGMSLVAPLELYPGETVAVMVEKLPGLNGVELILLRVQPLRGHYLCAGRFLDPSLDQKKVLAEVVDGLVRALREGGAVETT